MHSIIDILHQNAKRSSIIIVYDYYIRIVEICKKYSSKYGILKRAAANFFAAAAISLDSLVFKGGAEHRFQLAVPIGNFHLIPRHRQGQMV